MRKEAVAIFLTISKYFITVGGGMVRMLRCHRRMNINIINESEVPRSSVAIHVCV